MASKSSNRRKKQNGAGQPRPAPAKGATTIRARKPPGDDAWELVHPRCARDRADDLEEVRKMLEAGEVDVAIDECRWLLQGCSDCLEAHRILGEIALGENDLPLARGHFGYAYRLGAQALEQAGGKGPLPYRLAANQGFHESGKALAWCLMQMGKPEMAAEVVERLLSCDAGDPLGVKNLLAADGR
ncbi:MAG: hypothetical protein WDZ48_02720 [Pirellulales bacterium]